MTIMMILMLDDGVSSHSRPIEIGSSAHRMNNLNCHTSTMHDAIGRSNLSAILLVWKLSLQYHYCIYLVFACFIAL